MSNEGQEYANLYTIFFLNKEIDQLRKNKQTKNYPRQYVGLQER